MHTYSNPRWHTSSTIKMVFASGRGSKKTEEIHIEKLNEQWVGIPHKKLLNQSFQDQLNSFTNSRTTGTFGISQAASSGQHYRYT